jgi:hypothetical protein
MAIRDIPVRFGLAHAGFLHAGNVSAALGNGLLARRMGTSFLPRVENPDMARPGTRIGREFVEDPSGSVSALSACTCASGSW